MQSTTPFAVHARITYHLRKKVKAAILYWGLRKITSKFICGIFAGRFLRVRIFPEPAKMTHQPQGGRIFDKFF